MLPRVTLRIHLSILLIILAMANSTVKRISGPMQTERLSNGERRLLRDLTISTDRGQFTVPAGFESNFSSIPQIFAFIVRWSRVDYAGVFHDFGYIAQEMDRETADWLWYEVATAGDHRANTFQALVCYTALRIFSQTFWNRRTAMINRKLGQ